jgi:integrase
MTQQTVANSSKLDASGSIPVASRLTALSSRPSAFGFTKKKLDSLPLPKNAQRTYFYDTQTRGLALAISPGGKKVFVLYRKIAGKPERINIGPYPDLTIEQARGKAAELNGRIAAGKNPADERRRKRDAAGEVNTLGQLIEAYVIRQILPYSSRPEKAAYVIRRVENVYLSDWKNKPLADITKKLVLSRHAEIGREHGPIIANRTMGILKTAFNWASGDVELWTGPNPAKLSKAQRFEEHERSRYLTPDEMVRFNAALDEETNKDLHDFVVLGLSTGQRRGNVLGMRWEQVAENFSTWTIPKTKTKNKATHTVELQPAAILVLKDRKQNRKEGNPWVFPSETSASGHLEEIKRSWKRLLKRAGLHTPGDPDRITVHSLRHTNVSYMVMAGRSLEQAGAAVGHLSPGSTKRYSHLHQQVQRETARAGAKKMERMVAEAARKNPALLGDGNG